MLDRIRSRVVRACVNIEDYSSVGRSNLNANNVFFAKKLEAVVVEISDIFEDLPDKLLKHLTNQYLEGKLRWVQI